MRDMRWKICIRAMHDVSTIFGIYVIDYVIMFSFCDISCMQLINCDFFIINIFMLLPNVHSLFCVFLFV